MPTYQYRCTECGRDLEVVQKFSDASLTECPTCAGQLRKVFNAVGVVFKGSGFYRTDSRSGGSDSNGSDKGDRSDKGSEKSDKGSESTESGKPAKVAAETKSETGSKTNGSTSEKVASSSGSSSTGSKAAAK